MKATLFFAAILAITATAQGQSCSTLNPCAGVTITNTSMASTVTNSAGGVETSGPGTVTLWKCIGNSSTCSGAALTSAVTALTNNQTVTGVWTYVQFPHTQSSVTYNDPEPYGSQVNYAAMDAWTGGGSGPVSAIATFQLPQAPKGAPGQANTPSVTLVVTGSSGPQ